MYCKEAADLRKQLESMPRQAAIAGHQLIHFDAGLLKYEGLT